MVRKGIIVCDEQVPFHIDLSGVNKYIADEKPDIICRLGDMLDLRALTGWTNTAPADIDWGMVLEELAQGNSILDAQSRLHKPHDEHYWTGNHEERLEKFLAKHPAWVRKNPWVPSVVRDLNLKRRGMKVHSQMQLVRFGDLYMFHGDDYSTNHCRNNARNYGVKLAYGHVHTCERQTVPTPVDKSYRSAWSIGCLCDRDPDWKRGKPNSWVQGFATFYIDERGITTVYPIDIYKGQFVAPNGKLYK